MALVTAGQRITADVLNQNYTDASVATHTVTAASATALTDSWPIAANDASAAGTTYRITARGYGTWGSTAQNLAVQCGINGSAIRTETIQSSVLGASAGFEWAAEYEVTVLSTGSGGKAWISCRFTLSGTGASHSLTTGQLTIVAGSNGNAPSGESFNTATSNTVQIMCSWAATTGSPTITCVAQTFERITPS